MKSTVKVGGHFSEVRGLRASVPFFPLPRPPPSPFFSLALFPSLFLLSPHFLRFLFALVPFSARPECDTPSGGPIISSGSYGNACYAGNCFINEEKSIWTAVNQILHSNVTLNVHCTLADFFCATLASNFRHSWTVEREKPIWSLLGNSFNYGSINKSMVKGSRIQHSKSISQMDCMISANSSIFWSLMWL